MNGLIAQILAAFAAFAAATGSPVDANKLPDRPAIVQSAPASSKNAASNSNPTNSTKPSDDKTKSIDNSTKANRVEIQGTVVSVSKNGNTTTIVVGDKSVIIDAKTKVEGKLDVGAKVQIEAIKQADGSLVASQVETNNAGGTVKPSDDKSAGTQTKTDGTKKDDKNGVKSGSDDTKSDDKSGTSTSGDDKSGSNSSGDSKSGGDSSGKSGSGSDDPSGHK